MTLNKQLILHVSQSPSAMCHLVQLFLARGPSGFVRDAVEHCKHNKMHVLPPQQSGFPFTSLHVSVCLFHKSHLWICFRHVFYSGADLLFHIRATQKQVLPNHAAENCSTCEPDDLRVERHVNDDVATDEGVFKGGWWKVCLCHWQSDLQGDVWSYSKLWKACVLNSVQHVFPSCPCILCVSAKAVLFLHLPPHVRPSHATSVFGILACLPAMES